MKMEKKLRGVELTIKKLEGTFEEYGSETLAKKCENISSESEEIENEYELKTEIKLLLSKLAIANQKLTKINKNGSDSKIKNNEECKKQNKSVPSTVKKVWHNSENLDETLNAYEHILI